MLYFDPFILAPHQVPHKTHRNFTTSSPLQSSLAFPSPTRITTLPKTKKHAPYSKKVLIPLWTLQLAPTLFLFVETLLSLSWSSAYRTPRGKAFDAFIIILSFTFFASIIYIVTLFTRFRLSTAILFRQSLFGTVLGGILAFMLWAAQWWLMGIFAGVGMSCGVGLTIYGWVVRKKVRRGIVEEMRRGKDLDAQEGRGIELDGGRKVVPSVVVPVGSGTSSAPSRSRPSLGSVATGGEGSGPAKDAREFV